MRTFCQANLADCWPASVPQAALTREHVEWLCRKISTGLIAFGEPLATKYTGPFMRNSSATLPPLFRQDLTSVSLESAGIRVRLFAPSGPQVRIQVVGSGNEGLQAGIHLDSTGYGKRMVASSLPSLT
jgi:hypothetical protein